MLQKGCTQRVVQGTPASFPPHPVLWRVARNLTRLPHHSKSWLSDRPPAINNNKFFRELIQLHFTYCIRANKRPLLIKLPLQPNLNNPPFFVPKVHLLELFWAKIRKRKSKESKNDLKRCKIGPFGLKLGGNGTTSI